jgi:hypothetical protein
MELSGEQPDDAEKVERVERRRFSWRTVFYGFTRSRRRAQRRDADTDEVFVDWHEPWLFYMATGTMLLSATDAFLTLQLLDRGMIEANPVMAKVISYGTGAFASTKLAMTAFGILVLVFLARTRFLNRFKTGLLLSVFCATYICLVTYELVSLFVLM